VADEALGALDALAREAGARRLPVVSGDPWHSRMRARLMVRGRAASPKVGLYQRGTHRIVDIPDCRVHDARINEVAAALKRALRATRTPPYAERPHRGVVRAVQVAIERPTGRVQVVVVANAATPTSAAPLLDALAQDLGDPLAGLWWNGNPDITNRIVGRHWQLWCGEAFVRDRIGGADVFTPPGAFGQSHLGLADRIVARIHAAAVRPGSLERIVELHAGCGATGLGLLARGHEVVFNEISRDSIAGLERGIAAQGPAARARATVVAGEAAAAVGWLADADVVIADPPRRGLDTTTCEALAARPPARLLYASCGLDAFMRDARALLARRRLRLVQLEPFALFPFTRHVETLALFERVRDGG